MSSNPEFIYAWIGDNPAGEKDRYGTPPPCAIVTIPTLIGPVPMAFISEDGAREWTKIVKDRGRTVGGDVRLVRYRAPEVIEEYQL